VRVQVTVDGATREVDVDVAALSLQQSCLVEDQLGADGFDAYLSGRVGPKALRAILWAKLVGEFPELSIDDFDAFGGVDDVDGEDPGPLDGD
jgi:hypothetical protein